MSKLNREKTVNLMEFFRQSVLKAAHKNHLSYIHTSKSPQAKISPSSEHIPDSLPKSFQELAHHTIWNFSLLDSWQQVYQLAEELKQKGINPGDRVGICLENSPLHLWLHLACIKIGAITLLLPYQASSQELELILKDAQVSLVYIAPEEKRFHNFSYPTVTYDLEQNLNSEINWEIREQSLAALQQPVSPPPANTLSTLLYTSGSSGCPKGVGLTQENLHYASLNFRAGFKYQADQGVSGVCAPLSHIGGFNGTTLDRFIHGGKVVLFSSFVPETVLHYLEAYQINMMFLVPTMAWALISCSRWEESNLSAFNKPLIGGAALKQDLCEMLTRKNLHPIHVWGMTELAGSGTCISTASRLESKGSSFTNSSSIPIGFAFPYNQIKLCASEDSQNTPASHTTATGRKELNKAIETIAPSEAIEVKSVPISVTEQKNYSQGDSRRLRSHPGIGEIAVKGPAVFHGYWHEIQLYKSSSGYQVLARTDYFRTGDLAKEIAPGIYQLEGRKNRLFKSGGEFISPELIEEKLSNHPQIKQVAAYAISHQYWGEVLCVCLVTYENTQFYSLDTNNFPAIDSPSADYPSANSPSADYPSANSPSVKYPSTSSPSSDILYPSTVKKQIYPTNQLFSLPLETLTLLDEPAAEIFKEYLCQNGLARWKIPKFFLLRDTLPVNGNGKIDFQQLKSQTQKLLENQGKFRV